MTHMQTTYGVNKRTFEVLREWRRDCGDYVVPDDDGRIEIERPVVLRGRYFHEGVYHWHMLEIARPGVFLVDTLTDMAKDASTGGKA